MGGIRAGAAKLLFVTTLAALAVAHAVSAQDERERWQDDKGPSQGVEFTRNITHTLVPTFLDQRGATFTCGDGQSFDDPLVVIAAGDGSGSDLNVPIASDGSFSYSGPATMNNGSGTMDFQGRFSGTSAAGSVHWKVTRDSNGTSCTADSGTAQWTAHCSEQCGGSSTGTISVAIDGKAVVGQWALVDVTVKSDGAGRIAAFAHLGGKRACGTFTDEAAVAARKGRPGPVVSLGEAQVTGPGTFVFHGKYVPDQFGHSDRICAYLTQAPAGDTVLAHGEGTPKIGFALPWTGAWNANGLKSGLYRLGTPYRQAPALHGTARGFQILGTWACDGGRIRAGHVTGRRWWLATPSFSKSLLLTPIKPHADGSFSFTGKAYPDFTNNYEPPIPRMWPARSMHISIKGRFSAGHGPDGFGDVAGGKGKLIVVNGSRRCATSFKLHGEGALSDLPAATDRRYDGTITPG